MSRILAHLGKPIQLEDLKAALEKWKPKGADRNPASSQACPEKPTAENIPVTETVPAEHLTSAPAGKTFTPEHISTTGKVVFNRADLMNRMLEDMEMAKLTAEAFVGDLPKQLANIRQAIKNGDPAATSSAAHRLKGAAGTMGGDALARSRSVKDFFRWSSSSTRCAARKSSMACIIKPLMR